MRRITLYRHPECERCRKMGQVHATLDWLGRIERSSDTPPSGALKPGEIAVVDHRSGRTLFGIHAVRMVARQVPAYLPILPLLYLPPIARKLDAMTRGCEDGACGLPETTGAASGRAEG